MDPQLRQQIELIHATRVPMVVAITGGGTGALGELLAIPGGSQVLREAIVPYDQRSLADWLGGRPTRACSGPTASSMAMAALLRAQQLTNTTDCVGIGATASLVSSRPKRGEHRIHAAWQTPSASGVLSLVMNKWHRDRAGEEDVASQLVLAAMSEGTGAPLSLELPLLPHEEVERHVVQAPTSWQELLKGEREMVAEGFDPTERPLPLFPGAFNRLHAGHRGMARVAAEKLGRPVVWELAIVNVDKPPLDFLALENRTSQLKGDPYVLTRAPTFVEKGELFPACTFVVGIDTIERIAQVRYYRHSRRRRDAALTQLAELGCRFLVFGRERQGRFETLDDVELPPALRLLCDEVSEEEFRHDISSTALRQRRGRGRE